jgi:hypothetical protein
MAMSSTEPLIGKLLLVGLLALIQPHFRADETRPPVKQPEPEAKVVATPLAHVSSTTVSAGKRGRALTSGAATWYDYVPGGAAAGPALRRALGAGWRGTTVMACYRRDCVRVNSHKQPVIHSAHHFST